MPCTNLSLPVPVLLLGTLLLPQQTADWIRHNGCSSAALSVVVRLRWCSAGLGGVSPRGLQRVYTVACVLLLLQLCCDVLCCNACM